MPGIENAISFETTIEIISEEASNQGIYFLQRTLVDMFASADDFSLMPIMMGGNQIGEALSHSEPGTTYDLNPMRMSYYNKNERRKGPECVDEPKLEMILKADGTTRAVVFAEAVVDSQGTIKASMAHINKKIDEYNKDHNTTYAYPEFHTFALVCKIEGETEIPELFYAYHVHKDIWVHGRGCDNDQKGREDKRIMGMLAADATTAPSDPYYQKIPMWD